MQLSKNIILLVTDFKYKSYYLYYWNAKRKHWTSKTVDPVLSLLSVLFFWEFTHLTFSLSNSLISPMEYWMFSLNIPNAEFFKKSCNFPISVLALLFSHHPHGNLIHSSLNLVFLSKISHIFFSLYSHSHQPSSMILYWAIVIAFKSGIYCCSFSD